MHYLIVSFTHKNTTLDVRERVATPRDDLKHSLLKKINENRFINESLILSTCNRVEIFCSVSSPTDATAHIFQTLSNYSSLSLEELEGCADIFEDQGAIHHLFAVASSLDSMVVGETQITGQLKDAYKFANDNNYCSQKISRAMHYAFKCAADVRNSSSISSKPVSIASVAVLKAEQEVGNISGKKALIIGTGEMSVIIIKNLLKQKVKITLMNRTRSKAEDLGSEFDGVDVVDFSELPTLINEHELLFTATSSQKAIIREEMLSECNFDRHWFDMAVPRDIDVKCFSGVSLFQIDDFKAIVNENMSMRQDEARASHAVVGRYILSFYEWLKTLSVEPLIKEMYTKGFEAARAETERVINKGFLPRQYEEEARKMSEQTIKRFLHDLTTKMRDMSENSKSDSLTESMMFLMGNMDEKPAEIPAKYKHMIKDKK